MRPVPCLLALALLPACSSPPSPPADLGVEAAAHDAAIDVGRDMPAQLDMLVSDIDAGVDDLGADFGMDASYDAGTDAGPPCIASSECVTATVIGVECVERPVEDGMPCTTLTDGICVVGTCVARTGCGDGYREPGPAPAREGCDDGNVTDGDLCSSTCTPTQEHVPGLRFAHDSTVSRTVAAAADGHGARLLVWLADETTGPSVHGRRYDALGAPTEPAPGYLVLRTGDADGTDMDPNVTGLPHGGWAVVSSPHGGCVLRIVRPDGTLGSETVVGGDVAAHARVTALADGTIVVVWVELGTLSGPDPLESVHARLYTESGAARGAGFTVPIDGSLRELSPSVAAGAAGDGEWMATWSHESSAAGPMVLEVRGRRFRDSTPLDATDLVLVPDGHTSFVAALHDHDYALAWTFNAGHQELHTRIVRGASPGYTSAADLALSTMVDSVSPSIAVTATDDYAIAWRLGTHVDFGFTPGLTATPEGSALQAMVHTFSQGDVSIVPARGRGAWLVWTEIRPTRPPTDPSEDVMVAFIPDD